MVIKYRKRYIKELKIIYDFIAKDSENRAKEFKEQLLEKIEQLPNNPLKYRKSLNFNDESIRDLIFKGYVIPYFISNDTILILGIYKANEWST